MRNDKVEELHGSNFLKLKSGRRVGFYDAKTEAKRNLTRVWMWLSRMGKLAHDDAEDYDWEQIGWFVDELATLVGIWRREIEKHNVRARKTERIAALRDTRGRTSEEAAAYLAKADELEREVT